MRGLKVSIFVAVSGIAFSGGMSADKVSVMSSGHLNTVHEHVASRARGAAHITRSEALPDEDKFELDIPAPSTDAGSPHIDSPFEVDKNYSPFVIDDGSSRSAIESQAKEAEVVNDSPFMLDNQAHSAPADSFGGSTFVMNSPKSSAKPQTTPGRDSPFVVDVQAQPAAKRQTQTIVRNGDSRPGPQPATTRMVLANIPGQTTTAHPATTSKLTFELGGSMLEIAAGQKFVPIADTPFEVETQVALSLANARKGPIELKRSGSVAAPASLAQLSEEETATRRLSRNQDAQVPGMDLSPTTALAYEASLHENKLGEQDAAAHASAGRTALSVKKDAALLDAAADPKAQNQLGGAGEHGDTHTGAQLPPVTPGDTKGVDDSSSDSKDADPTAADSNNASAPLSAPASIFNATIHDEAPLNATVNGTTHFGAISTRGAALSIVLGLFVTIFFLSIVLCILKAGILKEAAEGETKEPPRPTPSYRQLMRAQQQPEVTAATGNPPSV